MLKYMYVLYTSYMNKNVCHHKFYLNTKNGLIMPTAEKKTSSRVTNNHVKRYVHVCTPPFATPHVEWCTLIVIDIKILYIYTQVHNIFFTSSIKIFITSDRSTVSVWVWGIVVDCPINDWLYLHPLPLPPPHLLPPTPQKLL